MARILLGWELGAGQGHAVKLRAIAGRLAARGHEVVYAVQNLAAVAGAGEAWQAPLWPAQLVAAARPVQVTPATMGDILVALGLADAGAFAGLIGAWDRLLAAVRPDGIVADFAPALSAAAAGRVPVVATGTGFSLPPGTMPRFPSLTGEAAVHDEARLLDGVNAALAAHGRVPLPGLPALFAADRQIVATFAELDPYHAWRSEPLVAASTAAPVPLAGPEGDELFVYLNGHHPKGLAFWQGLALSGLKVRIHDPTLNRADHALLRGAGLLVEERPAATSDIVARSRLLLSHGGLGLASTALLAGLPHVIAPFDVEKRMIAAAVAAMDLGRIVWQDGLEAEPFAAFLRDAFADDALAARARAAAPGFRARATVDADVLAAGTIVELVSG